MDCFQQPQHVVLLIRDVPPREQFVFEFAEAVVRPPEAQVRFLFRGVESTFPVSSHTSKIHDTINSC